MTRSLVPVLGRLSVVLVLCAAAESTAQLLPLGPEVQVNTYTTGIQALPRIAVSADGSFLVVWCCAIPDGGGSPALVARKFDPSGQPLDPEFALTEGDIDYPSGLAAESDGDHLVVWGEGDLGCPINPCAPDFVKGLRLSAAGLPLGPVFNVSPPPGTQYTGHADVAARQAGGFVVSWYDGDLRARRYDTDGQAIEQGFLVDGASVFAGDPALAAQPDDGFVVVWHEPDAQSDFLVRARRYDGDAVPVGTPIEVAGGAGVDASFGDVGASPAGDFAVVWTDRPTGSTTDVGLRRIAADGTPLAAATRANTYTTGNQFDPTVEREADSGFVIAWSSHGSAGGDQDLSSVQLRRFAADGTALGADLQVNSLTTDGQSSPQVAVLPGGDLLLVWSSGASSGSDQDSYSIQLRRFRVPFFTDGVESGDLLRWSSSQP